MSPDILSMHRERSNFAELVDLPPPESYPTDSLPAAEELLTMVMRHSGAERDVAIGWLVAADFPSLVKGA